MTEQTAPWYESLRIEFDPRHIARLMPFKAKSDIRYYLCGILVEKAPPELGGVYLVACDGHTMAVIHDKTGSISGADYAIVRIESGTASAANTACKKKYALMKYRFVMRGRRVAIAIDSDWERSGRDLYVQAGHALVEGKFPDWRKVVPPFANLKRGAFGESDGVNPVYIARLAFLDGDKHGGRVSMWQEGPGKAVICQMSSIPEMIVVVMPMRGDAGPPNPAAFPMFAATPTDAAPITAGEEAVPA